MSDSVRRSALAGQVGPSRQLGAIADYGPGITLSERRFGAVMQLNGAPADAALAERIGALNPAPAPLQASQGGSFQLLWNGPRQWLVTSTSQSADDLRADLEAKLSGPHSDSTLTDLSHARTVITVAGLDVRALVPKGCPLDIDAMGPGFTSPSLFGHFNVQIHCRQKDCFDFYVFRSFGLAMWEALIEEALEYGCQIEPPGE